MQNAGSKIYQKLNMPFPAQGDTMLASVVIHLEAINAGELLPETGRKIHGFWHDQWQQVSPKLADEIHPENSLPSFTLTPLMGLPKPEKNRIRIETGQKVWFRMTTLQSSITETLFDSQQGWLCSLPAESLLARFDGKPYSDLSVRSMRSGLGLARINLCMRMRSRPNTGKWNFSRPPVLADVM